MKKFSGTVKAFMSLCISVLISTPAFAHSGHGQDGNFFHGDIHVSWIVLAFVVVAYAIAFIKGTREKQ